MGTLFKLILLVILGALGFWLFQQAGIESAKGSEASGDVMVIYWGGLILCSVGIAVLAAFTLLPKIGELMAGFFYSAPSEEVEKGPHTEALAKIAAGDYEGAIQAYEKALEKDPEDVRALVEISKIHADRLGDPAAAAARLEVALEREWPKDKVGPVMFRLADIYWRGLDNGDRARALLEQILEILPGTTHAANAGARLREIEQTEREREEAAFLAGSAAAAPAAEPAAAEDAGSGFAAAAQEEAEPGAESGGDAAPDGSQRGA